MEVHRTDRTDYDGDVLEQAALGYETIEVLMLNEALPAVVREVTVTLSQS